MECDSKGKGRLTEDTSPRKRRRLSTQGAAATPFLFREQGDLAEQEDLLPSSSSFLPLSSFSSSLAPNSTSLLGTMVWEIEPSKGELSLPSSFLDLWETPSFPASLVLGKKSHFSSGILAFLLSFLSSEIFILIVCFCSVP